MLIRIGPWSKLELLIFQETKKFLEDHVEATLAKVTKGGEHGLLTNYHSAWKEFSQGIDYLHMLYS